MKTYRLKKDLPTFKAGELFELYDTDHDVLRRGLKHKGDGTIAYLQPTLDKFPNILAKDSEWFEEVEESSRVWEPRNRDRYWHLFSNGDINDPCWANNELDKECLAIGNCFPTEEAAKKAAEWLKARKILLDDTKGFKPDWKNVSQPKWYVSYSENMLYSYTTESVFSPGPYFATEEDADASIKAHEKEWKIYLGVEE